MLRARNRWVFTPEPWISTCYCVPKICENWPSAVVQWKPPHLTAHRPRVTPHAELSVEPSPTIPKPAIGATADGMVEEIITALSRFKSLFIIARNSSFTFKGKAVDIKEVGRRLGVRYVLLGAVRKASGKVRSIRTDAEITSCDLKPVCWEYAPTRYARSGRFSQMFGAK